MAVDVQQDSELSAAIKKAVSELPAAPVGDAPPNEEPENTPSEGSDEAKTSETATAAEPDEEMVQGKNLVQALKDPARAAILIDFLAKQAGYTKGELRAVEGKQEVKEVAKDLTKVLEEELGDELKFLAPKLGKALTTYLKDMKPADELKTQVEELRTRFENQEREKIEKITLKAHVDIAQKYFNSDDMPANVLQELSKAMDKFPPQPNSDPAEYYNDVFTFVAGKLDLKPKNPTKEQRIVRNRQDASVRNLSATDSGVSPEGSASGKGSKRITLDEAIRAGVAEVEAAAGKK